MTKASRTAILLALGLTLALGGCSATFRNHGYVARQDQLEQIRLGLDTRDSVVEKIGPPATDGLRRKDAWYYVESRFRQFGLGAPKEVERTVLKVSFDRAGRVSNIERFGLEDGRIVRLQTRVTETVASDIGFLGQIFGSLGNPDAGALLN